MKREPTTKAKGLCEATSESIVHSGWIVEAGAVSLAIQYFDRLVEPRIVAVDDLTATISHVQSGLGNRAFLMIGFSMLGEAESFVDQIAQRAIESRGRLC
ncbi:hypothetical protein [uncultured Cohaesibacter sp.]|uniref:hypothetical protein n=1 Tax=uncultured Cohaesibacter sp. TaxID=1002546 RepID=UPI002AA70301|nr:hypothetical protein [uncultured Cohaesibacter sp.]